jgi:hypothetical protein
MEQPTEMSAFPKIGDSLLLFGRAFWLRNVICGPDGEPAVILCECLEPLAGEQMPFWTFNLNSASDLERMRPSIN